MELQVTVDYTCKDGSLQAKHNYRLAGQELRRPVTGASGYIHAAKFAEFLGYILRRMGADRCDTRRGGKFIATLRSSFTLTSWSRKTSPASIRYTGVYHLLPTSSSQNRWKVGAGDIVSVSLRSS